MPPRELLRQPRKPFTPPEKLRRTQALPLVKLHKPQVMHLLPLVKLAPMTQQRLPLPHVTPLPPLRMQPKPQAKLRRKQRPSLDRSL
jgi:hypothetical protein